MSLSIDTSVPSVAVPGEPDEGDEVSVEELLDFVGDIVGHPEYILNYRPVIGRAS